MCTVQDAGTVELYFYGELDRVERAQIDAHLRVCRECADALAELKLIREALDGRPQVTAPPGGDWSGFMTRLDAAVGAQVRPPAVIDFTPRVRAVRRRPFSGWIAAAALLALVSASVFLASRVGREALQVEADPAAIIADANAFDDQLALTSGLASVGARHLERSKLVVLGLATKEPDDTPASDWAYERELATSLLNDTRLYRMAAEERGLVSLAGVMKDLEIVLLQTAMAQESDATALPQIQRLIRKRSLVEKIDVVATTGMVP